MTCKFDKPGKFCRLISRIEMTIRLIVNRSMTVESISSSLNFVFRFHKLMKFWCYRCLARHLAFWSLRWSESDRQIDWLLIGLLVWNNLKSFNWNSVVGSILDIVTWPKDLETLNGSVHGIDWSLIVCVDLLSFRFLCFAYETILWCPLLWY